MLTAESRSVPTSSRVAIVTGANSGVGYGIVQRLLEHTLDPRNEQLTIVMACRNSSRAEAARAKLLAQYASEDMKEKAIMAEGALQILIVDLSSTKSVFGACEEFKRRFSRLDYLILNAGILPCDHMNIKEGLKNLVTRPAYVAKTGGDFFSQRQGTVTAEGLGEVFAANVFGHYIMVKELEESMRGSPCPRILWFSSTTACPEFFSVGDFQCVRGDHPYESSKRLCELLAIDMHDELRQRNIYSFVVSPGNCFTGLLDQGWIVAACWVGVLYLMRFLFISGCNITPRNGATSAFHLACEVANPTALDPTKLYHADISPLGRRYVRELTLPAEDPKTVRSVRREMDELWRKFRAVAVRDGILAR
ncbi:hypothetical protein SpCBS45565_g01280 [Spizellomyces sp. 'palustris']|nr:hypothetical protein SpCBS45565_g01280 [Spizellomyces sp. 'palustris']